MRARFDVGGFLCLFVVAGACGSTSSNGSSALKGVGNGTSSSGGTPGGGGTSSSGMSDASAGGGTESGQATQNPAYHVIGNQVLDKTGKAHLFRGLARPSTEWNSMGQFLSAVDFKNMAMNWKANVVRVTMNQDFWLDDPSNGSYDPGYAGVIDQEVQWAEMYGMDVILDLHWSDQGSYSTGAQCIAQGDCQQCMADQHSILFWQQVAAMYANDGHVLFELYNEPYDVSPQVWLSGGASTSGGCNASFTVAGMQQLYSAVRAAAPDNLVIIGGLDYSYNLAMVSGNLVSGTNIIYNTHPYSYKCGGCTASDFDSAFGFLTATQPVIATEFGDQDCTAGFYQTFTQYAHTKGMHWTAWAYWSAMCNETPPEPASCCQFPSLIADLVGTPIQGSGTTVQAALMNP